MRETRERLDGVFGSVNHEYRHTKGFAQKVRNPLLKKDLNNPPTTFGGILWPLIGFVLESI
jgi:hypothetical protein